MAVCRDCSKTITRTSESESITLPTVGVSGVSVNLGAASKQENYADVSKTLGLVNSALMAACEGRKSAAYSNDPDAYKQWGTIAQNQVTKLQQLEDAIVAQENGGASPSPSPSASPGTQAGATPTSSPSPTPKTGKIGKKGKGKRSNPTAKWASTYAPKAASTARKVKLPQNLQTSSSVVAAPVANTAATASQAAPTPPVLTPAVKAVLEAPPQQLHP
ncbi:MAG TPA: hypothetical protein VGI60_15090 [Chthoniobacterales bacterium]